MRTLAACALILATFTLAPAHAANLVPHVAQLADVVIAVESGRYARTDCTPHNPALSVSSSSQDCAHIPAQ